MIPRFFKRLLPGVLSIIILNASTVILSGQNIYDAEHTKAYAEFLYKTEDYKGSAKEYERLLKIEPQNYTALDSCISIRKKLELNQSIAALLRKKYSPSAIPPKYNYTLIISSLKSEAPNASMPYLLKYRKQAPKKAEQLDIVRLLLSGKYRQAMKISEKKNSPFHYLADSLATIKYKKPLTAALLSVIVPGSGFFYAENPDSGIKFLSIIALNTFQAVKTYKIKGQAGVYPIAFSALAVGFYTGNIYGSYREAKHFNARKREQIKQEIFKILTANPYR
ncbi:MAG: hypothetical protein U9N85_00250 [Bacteroidota bacterium]|nr:hypothetical protein [Bacteroidota bacterium]